MAIRIGTNPIAWSNDDLPELGGDTPLETCLRQARQAGYDGIELGNKFPRDPAILTPILEHHELELISGWYSASLLSRSAEDEIQAMQPHLELLLAMGCAVMVFAETSNAIHGDRSRPVNERPVLPDSAWDEFCRRLTDVGDDLAGRGIRLAYHHHMGTVIETEGEVDRLMAETGPSVGLLLDTGHAVFAGADPARLARAHGGRIVHVHCKDVRTGVAARAVKQGMSFLDSVIDGVFTVPGDGAVAFDPVLTALRQAEYAGWLVVEAEQDPAKADPLTYADKGYRNLVRMAGKAGLL